MVLPDFSRINEKIEEIVWLLSYEQCVVSINNLEVLKDFNRQETGWITINSDNPFVNAWYFDFNPETGFVAGDHSF